MRGVFRKMVLWHPSTIQTVPLRLKTGRTLTLGTTKNNSNGSYSYNDFFKKAAREEFVSKGFAFYSSELTEVCLLATRTINLVIDLYGSTLLDKLFLELCDTKANTENTNL